MLNYGFTLGKVSRKEMSEREIVREIVRERVRERERESERESEGVCV